MKEINIIAHRGAPYLAQENTLHSFQKALLFPIDMIELDVRVTSDGKPIVFHNNTLTYNPFTWIRTRKGFVKKFTIRDIKHRFESKNIPTLDETIYFLKDKINVNLHIKTLEAVKPAFEILKYHNFKENVLISSFRKKILRAVREKDSKIPLALLCWMVRNKILKFAKKFKINYIHPYYLFLTKKKANKIKKLGFGLNVWTVNSKRAAARMSGLKVDGIITDRPNLSS